MKFKHIAMIVTILTALSVGALWLMSLAFSAVSGSDWLAAVAFLFFVAGAVIAAGTIYGVWKWSGGHA